MKRSTIGDYSNNKKKEINGMNTSIEFIQYNETILNTKKIEKITNLQELIEPNHVNWIKISGLSDKEYISKICLEFGLYSFDIRELLENPQVIKIALYDKVTFALLNIFTKDDNDCVVPEQIALILGDNYLISFMENDHIFYEYIKTSIDTNIVNVKKKGADYLFYLLLSGICYLNNQFVLKAEEDLISIEETLLGQTNTDNMMHYLHNQRLLHTKMKHFTASFREEYENLFDNDNHLLKDETMNYFKNLDNRLRSLSSNIEYYRESLFSLLDLYYNNINTNTNNVMKRLTVISSIFIPMTFLAGVWGMNFTFMPELNWQYSYVCVWLLFLILPILIYKFLKKKKWF